MQSIWNVYQDLLKKVQRMFKCRLLRFLLALVLLYHGYSFSCYADKSGDTKMYFAMAADEKHFPWLLQLLGSIYRFNFDDIGAIAVFNLGFTPAQIDELNSIEKVTVYEVEQTNPSMFTYFKNRKWENYVRGWYSWKPVVIKQALDLFPYVLYLDSKIIVTQPLNNLFEHIRQNGYFLIDQIHRVKILSTTHVINKFDLDNPKNRYLSDAISIAGGVQGLTRELYNDYIMPMFELSKDIKNFEDDGSAPNGLGHARCDQTLFSIYAAKLNLKVMRLNDSRIKEHFYINGRNVPINGLGNILQLWVDLKKLETFKSYLKYKKK